MPHRIRPSAALALAVAAVAVLVGCTPAEEPVSSSPRAAASTSPSPSAEPEASGDSPSASATPSASAAPSTAPSPSPSASAPSAGAPVEDTATPLTLGCLDLVSLETMYEFNPNILLKDDYVPAAGSPAAVAVQNGGVACGWVHASSGEVIEIAAASPGSVTREALHDSAAAGSPSPGAGAEVFFVGGAPGGTVHAFTGSSWVTVASPWFTQSADAQPLTDAAVAAVD